MKEKKYVAFGKYRLIHENHTYSNYVKRDYYKLYKKEVDDFGNDSWNQIWSGSENSSDESDKMCAILADALYFRLSTINEISYS